MKTVSSQKHFRPFAEAKAFVHKLKLKSEVEWTSYAKYRPADIPSHPYTAYAGKGWKSWGDWLGTNKVWTRNRTFRRFTAARTFARHLKLKNLSEWHLFAKSGKRPRDIPHSPHVVYDAKGWKGYGDWLGTGRKHTAQT